MSVPTESYTVVRRPVRYLRISMDQDLKVTVVAPPQLTDNEVATFVASRAGWIAETRRRMQARVERAMSALPELPPGTALVRWQPMAIPPQINTPERVYAWYRVMAQERLVPRVAELAAPHGLKYNHVTIKDIRSKWGSCSSKGNINLNWRLIKAPDWVADYIILHELAHTIHLNHSADFWALVGKICPDYRTAEQWLKTYEQSLFV